MSKMLGWLAVGAVLGWASFALLHDLGQAPLQQYDEGTYAQVVHESFERGDFLTFTLGHEAWFEKPPLYFWLAGVATALTHDETLGIRLPAALAAIAVVGVMMLLVYAVSGSLWAAALAGALLVLTQPFIDGAREARLDLLVSLFILCAAYAFMRRWYAWFGVAVALAILSKSVIAVFGFGPPLVLAAYLHEWGFLREKKFWYGACAGLAIALPWHAYETARFGLAFWRQYVGVHVLERYEVNLFGDPRLQTDYTAHLFWFAPLLLFAVLVATVMLPLLWHRESRQWQAALLSFAATAALMLLVFYTAQTRAFSYLLPLYPFAAAYAGLIFGSFITRSAP